MRYNAVILIGVFLSVVICAALFFSYSAYIASNRVEKNFEKSLGQLAQEVNRLKAQLVTARNRTENNSTQTYTKISSTVTAGSKKNSIAKEHIAIRRLEKIIASTGLEQLAENQNMDPTILSELYDEYADRKQVTQSRELACTDNDSHRKSAQFRFAF